MGKLVDAFTDWVENGHMTRGESLGDFYRRFCHQYEAEHPTCGATREQIEGALEKLMHLATWEGLDCLQFFYCALGQEALEQKVRNAEAERDETRAKVEQWKGFQAAERKAKLRAQEQQYAAEDEVERLKAREVADLTDIERALDREDTLGATIRRLREENARLKGRLRFKVGQKVRIMSMPERVWEIVDVPLVAVHVVRPDDPERGQLLIPLGDLLEWPLSPEPKTEAKP